MAVDESDHQTLPTTAVIKVIKAGGKYLSFWSSTINRGGFCNLSQQLRRRKEEFWFVPKGQRNSLLAASFSSAIKLIPEITSVKRTEAAARRVCTRI